MPAALPAAVVLQLSEAAVVGLSELWLVGDAGVVGGHLRAGLP